MGWVAPDRSTWVLEEIFDFLTALKVRKAYLSGKYWLWVFNDLGGLMEGTQEIISCVHIHIHIHRCEKVAIIWKNYNMEVQQKPRNK